MKTRRGFFQSLAKAAAIIALAPQIAFRVKPEEIAVRDIVPFWCETERYTLCYSEDYLNWFNERFKGCPIGPDVITITHQPQSSQPPFSSQWSDQSS